MQLFILFCIYFLYLPYMFRALISPSSGVSQAVFYIQLFGSCGVYVAYLRVPVDLFPKSTSLLVQFPNHAHVSWLEHHTNQMVVYKKKQLEIPLMMGLWEPETCRVKIKEIKTQNKQLHPLVTLLQYVEKMHGMNNLKNIWHS